MTTPAGWYPDPHDERRLRYWDGAAWTGSVSEAHPPAPTGTGAHPAAPTGTGAQPAVPTGTGAPPAMGPTAINPPGGLADEPPPFVSSAVDEPSTPFRVGDGYGDVGPWLTDSFRVLGATAGPVALFLAALPALAFAVLAGAIGSSLRGVRLVRDGGVITLDGLGPGSGAVLALLALGSAVVAGIGWLAAANHLHTAGEGRPATVGRSLAAGLGRLPRAIAWLVAAALVLAVVNTLAIATIAVAAVVGGPVAVLATVVVFVGLLAMFPVAIWVGVRLGLGGVAMAVAPRGANPFAVSWRLTRGRWWATLGRLVLLYLITAGVAMAISVVAQALVLGRFINDISISADGGLLIEGRTLTTDDSVNLGKVLPPTPVLIGLAIVGTVGQAIQQAIVLAGMTGLYRLGGGPSER